MSSQADVQVKENDEQYKYEVEPKIGAGLDCIEGVESLYLNGNILLLCIFVIFHNILRLITR